MKNIINKNIIHKLPKGAFILFLGIVLGYLALVMVYMLPTSRMEQHVKESQEMFENEGISFNLIEGYATTKLDNYSDGLILNSAIYNGEESVWKKAAAIYQYRYGGEDYYHSLFKYLNNESGISRDSYERDWHGYLVYVKPLLLWMNYGDIRVLNMALQMIVVLYLIFLMCKKNISKYIPAFVMMLIFLTWGILWFSIEYSALFYVFMLASIFILKKNDILIRKNGIPEIFLIIGMTVSYIDVLTYPILTIGIPLVFLFIMNEDWSTSIQKIIGNIATASFWWLAGYGGMWAGKWVIASVILKSNVLKEAVLMVLYRMSQTSGESGVMIEITTGDVFGRNFGVYMKPVYLILLLLFGVWIVRRFLTNGGRKAGKVVLPYLIIMCMPTVWYLALGNHSYIHYWMTHRNIALMVFSGCAMLIGMVNSIDDQREINERKNVC